MRKFLLKIIKSFLEAEYGKKEMEECVMTKFQKLRVESYERLLKRLKSLSKVFDAMGIHSLKYRNFEYLKYLKGNLYDRKGLVELIKLYVKCIEPKYSETLDDREFQTLKDTLDLGKFSVRRLKKNSKYLTSGNDVIDKFINDIRSKATSISKVIEWIDYDKFEDIEYLAKGGFSTVYRANRIDKSFNKQVVLKSLDNSKDMTAKILNEVIYIYRIFFFYASA
jgi:hypothetical protein